MQESASGAFELAVIRMSQLFDLSNDSILYAGVYLPVYFFQSDDPTETTFIQDIFTFVKDLATYSLTDTEIALYSAMVLMSPSMCRFCIF